MHLGDLIESLKCAWFEPKQLETSQL